MVILFLYCIIMLQHNHSKFFFFFFFFQEEDGIRDIGVTGVQTCALPISVIIDFAETVAPAGDLGYMPGEDRYSLVTLVKWAQDPQFLTADFSVCLIAENLAELNPRIGRNPYAASIELPLPDEKERYEYVDWKIGQSGKKDAEISYF